MYKNNSGLIAKTKVSKYKKGLCFTEKLVSRNPLLFLYETVTCKLKNQPHKSKECYRTHCFLATSDKKKKNVLL